MLLIDVDSNVLFFSFFFFFLPFIGNMLHDHYKKRKSGVHDLSRIKALLLLMSFAYFSAYLDIEKKNWGNDLPYVHWDETEFRHTRPFISALISINFSWQASYHPALAHLIPPLPPPPAPHKHACLFTILENCTPFSDIWACFSL